MPEMTEAYEWQGRTLVGSDGEVSLMQPVPAASMQVLLNRFSDGASSLLLKSPAEPELQEFLTANGMRDAMVAALRGEVITGVSRCGIES